MAFPGCSGARGGKATAHYLGVGMGEPGLGGNTKPCYKKARGKESRKLIQEDVNAELAEARFSRAVGMSKQGAWNQWENLASCKIIRAEPWETEPHHSSSWPSWCMTSSQALPTFSPGT